MKRILIAGLILSAASLVAAPPRASDRSRGPQPPDRGQQARPQPPRQGPSDRGPQARPQPPKQHPSDRGPQARPQPPKQQLRAVKKGRQLPPGQAVYILVHLFSG